jgi:glycosyltransferase involved in cell wall biosynthesis
VKVLQVVDGVGWGGTKEQVYLTTRELAKKGVNIGIALAFQYKEMEEKLKPYGVKIHHFEDYKGSKSRFNPANWFRLKRIIEENGYDIVIANSPHATDYVRFTLPFLRKRPKLITVRRSGRIPSKFSKWFKYSVFDRIVVVSGDVSRRLANANFFPERLRVIKSGIDLTRFYPYRERKKELRKKLGLPLEGKIFINVANWNPPVKGQDLLLEAFKELNCSDCYLVSAGLETDGREARKIISRLGLEKRVIPLGFRKDIPDLLNASDYFVLSSNLEGIAGALLQAMATEMVVISTNAGGIKEYLKDGYNGFLVPIGDKEKLKRAMEKALNLSPERYRKLATRARETAKEYSIERTAEGYIKLFEELSSEP